MLLEQLSSRRGRRVPEVVLALAGPAVLAAGLGTVPGPGPALEPGRGAWTSAAGAALPAGLLRWELRP